MQQRWRLIFVAELSRVLMPESQVLFPAKVVSASVFSTPGMRLMWQMGKN
jgi:hypothetical protein